jgi:hypothetical protein
MRTKKALWRREELSIEIYELKNFRIVELKVKTECGNPSIFKSANFYGLV